MEKDHLCSQLRKIFDHFDNVLSELKYDGNIYRDKIIISSLCSVLNGYLACIDLIKAERCSQIPILLRSMIEAFIDIDYVCRNEEGYKSLFLEAKVTQKRFLENILKFEIEPDEISCNERIIQLKKEIKEHKDNNIKAREPWALKIHDSGIPRECKIEAFNCCTAVHNSLLELEGRHGIFSYFTNINCYPDFDLKSIESNIIVLCITIIFAVEQVCTFFKIDPGQDYIDAGLIFKNLCSNLDKQPTKL